MALCVITGGARSGKSRFAQQRALALGGDRVTFIATAQPLDEEMRRRIARHRSERPGEWTTIEAPHDAGAAVRGAATKVVVLDCLTILLSNALLRARPAHEAGALDAMAAEATALMDAAALAANLIVVTNEVGCGIHPESALGRWFRDGLGSANQQLAAAADQVILMVSGIPIPLKGRLGSTLP